LCAFFLLPVLIIQFSFSCGYVSQCMFCLSRSVSGMLSLGETSSCTVVQCSVWSYGVCILVFMFVLLVGATQPYLLTYRQCPQVP
jgi:hypothetical protein